MKEIKFKIWDKINKNLASGYEAYNSVCGWQNDETGSHIILRQEKYILLQYTGSEDKNGKEIYEGDIAKFVEEFNPFYERLWEYLGIIVYEFGKYLFREIKPYYDYDQYECDLADMLLENIEDFEIIGNIYENPELLEEK